MLAILASVINAIEGERKREEERNRIRGKIEDSIESAERRVAESTCNEDPVCAILFTYGAMRKGGEGRVR